MFTVFGGVGSEECLRTGVNGEQEKHAFHK